MKKYTRHIKRILPVLSLVLLLIPGQGFGQTPLDPGIVKKEIVRTDRLLDRLRNEAQRPVPPPMRRIYDQAVNIQRDAKNHFARGDHRGALELTRDARRIAIRLGRRAGAGFERQDVSRALRLTDGLIAEARKMALRRNSRRMFSRVDEAEDLQIKALNQFKRHNYGNAFRLTLKTRDVLKDAIGFDRPAVDENRVRAALVKTDEMIRKARDTLGHDADRSDAELIDKAISEQDSAWDEFGRQRLRAALAHTRIARDLLRKALRTTKEGNG